MTARGQNTTECEVITEQFGELQPSSTSKQNITTEKKSTCASNPVLWLVIAVVVGASIGLLLSEAGLEKESGLITLLALPGKLWLQALKCIVLPMIIFSMIGAMVMLRSLPGAKYLGFMVVGVYMLTTVVAAWEGCAMSVMILGPNVRVLPHPAAAADLMVVERGLLDTVVAMIENLVPKNLINDAATNKLLPVMIASIIFGLLVQSKQEDGSESVSIRLVSEFNDVVVKVVTFLMAITPFGVGSLVFESAARLDLAKMGSNIGFLMAATAAGLVLHACVFYPTLLMLIARRNPVTYFRNILPAFVTALGTSSSAAALPVSIRCAVERNDISPHIANFVLSLGATINMDGTTIYLICATYFLGALHGIEFGVGKFLLMVVLATLCSMGSAPIPNASLVLLATILTAVGVPVDETFGMISAVDWVLDRLRSSVNVAGDACAAAIIDYRSGLQEKKACVEQCEV